MALNKHIVRVRMGSLDKLKEVGVVRVVSI